MRKLISIFLVSIWLLNVIGGLAYYIAQLHYQRRTMHELLASTPKQQLTHLVLTTEEFEAYLYEEDELLIDGEMFDMAFTEMEGETIHAYGLFDKKESGLITSLREQSKRTTENSATQQILAQFMALNFLPASFEINNPLGTELKFMPDSRKDIYTSAPILNNTPPPQLA